MDVNHWCGIVADLDKGLVTVFDPQQASDRIARLRYVAVNEIIPLLPPRGNDLRAYKTSTFSKMTQVDNYNCGVFVLTFFEAMLTESKTSNLEDNDERVAIMQLFRLKYLCYALA